MQLGLKGTSALTTGGSKGIGFGIAKQLSAEGVNLILVARDEVMLRQAQQLICAQHSVSVRIKSAGLYDAEIPEELANRHPDVDFLINNANTPSGGSLEGLSEQEWMHRWSRKPFGYIRMMRASYRYSADGAGAWWLT